MNVYRVSERLKVFIFFFLFLQILVFSGLLLIPFISLSKDSGALQLYNSCRTSIYLYYLMPLLIFSVILFETLLIINVFKTKVVLKNNKVISVNIFRTRRLNFVEIQGFTINRSSVCIVAKNQENKCIRVNLLSIERPDNLLRNLEMRFSNLESYSQVNITSTSQTS